MQILLDYLVSIKDIKESDKEHSKRTQLETFLNAIKNTLNLSKDINIHHEPNNDKSGLGAPDFQILSKGLTLGYIENKRVGADLQALINEANKNENAQIAKYLNLSPNLILTDYLRFLLLGRSGNKDENKKGKIIIIKECKICDFSELKYITKHGNLATKAQELLDFFKLFFTANPKSITTARDFASALAFPTRYLKDELISLENDDKMQHFYKNFLKGIYQQINFKDFCDNFAQTLIYALFLAKFQKDTKDISQNTQITLSNLTDYINESFELLGAVANELKILNDFTNLKWLLERILYVINHINVSDLILEFNKHNKETNFFGDKTTKNPTIHFYEHFINAYNPKLRKEKGVYYTPESVVSFIVNSIDIALKQDLACEDGLENATKSENMRLLDFATGTGAFLLEAFHKASERFKMDKELGDYREKVKKLIHNFRAFELMVAPYAIANLNLSIFLKDEFDYILKENERLNIFLTNTLEKKVQTEAVLFEAKKEAEAAKATKDEEILIITGNPPYSGASANKGIFENEVKIAYGLEPSEQNFTDCEKNFISYFLNADENTTKSNFQIYKNTFETQFKSKKLKNEKNPKWILNDYVKFIRFAEQKIEAQDKGIIGIITANSFLNAPTFRGMRYHLLKSFDKIYILNLHGDLELGERCDDGSKDENVFAIKQGVCISIFIKNGSKKGDLAEIFSYDKLGKDKTKFNFLMENDLKSIKWQKLTPKEPYYLFIPINTEFEKEYDKAWEVQEIFGVSGVGVVTGKDDVLIATNAENLENQIKSFYNEFDKKLVQDIVYRPFDMQKIYYDLKKVVRPRYEIMQHFLQGENLGLLFDRGCSKFDVDNFFISDKIVDLHLIGSGSYIAPLYLYEKENEKSEKIIKSENFTPNFRKFIEKKYGEKFTPEQILGYIYAVLFHKNYREKFGDFLRIDYPKIPFVDSKENFLKLSDLGQKLIILHLMKAKLSDDELYRKLNTNENHIIDLNHTKFKPNEQRLFINENAYFQGVSEEIWDYKIGGYQVLDKYLKSHKDENIDYVHFSKIIKILQETIKLENELLEIKN